MSTTCLSSPPTHRRLRVDRLVSLVLGVALLVSALVSAAAGASEVPSPAESPAAVVVRTGDTLWELSRRHAPEGAHTMEYAQVIADHNGVRPGRLVPGTVLTLPADVD